MPRRKEMKKPAELTEKQWQFCVNYVKYRNQVKAYMIAYGANHALACKNATAVYKNKEVQKTIDKLLDDFRHGLKLDIKDLYQWHVDIVTDTKAKDADKVKALAWLGENIGHIEESGDNTNSFLKALGVSVEEDWKNEES